MQVPSSRRKVQLLLIAAGSLCFAAPAGAQQLNQNCVVSILNRNAPVNAAGQWVLPNIPAGFGQVRARATCVNGRITTSGQSALFTIIANRMNALPPITLGNSTPVPISLTLSAPATSLTAVGGTVQLTVTGTFPSGPSQNLTNAATGTAYTTSNATIATISVNGLVTAVRTGVALIQAINEGRSALLSINVTLLGGADSDGDGIPDDAEIRLGLNPNDPTDALLDLDHDGLTNLEEYRLGTDIRNPDTDGDGISDGDEVHSTGRACNAAGRCFRTNPLLADTDGDGISDLTEIQTGSDPTDATSINLSRALTGITVSPSNFTMIVNSISGTASVQLTVTGNLVDGRTIDLTSTARGTNYFSDRLANCNFGAPDGRVFAGAEGRCNITVSAGGFVTTVTGAVTNFSPLPLSFVTIPGFANAVAVSGDFAYVAAGASGLQVVSLSGDRLHPVISGTLALPGGASAFDVSLAGTTAYVAGSAGIHVIDITNPVVPVLRGSFATGGSALGVVVRGTTAYVASGSNLVLVNISNPAALIQISSLALGGTAWGLAVDTQRNLAAVANGNLGLKIVDISNPAAMVLRGTALTGDARGVALSGNFAFVADYVNSTTSVDITAPATPLIRSNILDSNLGGFLQGIALAGNFALAADVKFVNGIPITDVSTPTALQARAILNFPSPAFRDDNGMGIAVDSSFVYLATEHGSVTRGGSNGDSRLYIGQYLPRQDLAGVAPAISIVSPANGTVLIQGGQVTITANAIDDVAVASVSFRVNGQLVFTTTTAPYQYTFTPAPGINTLTLGATAADLGNNVGTAVNVTVSVIPDPLTLVTGLVSDANNVPVSGATVTAPGGAQAITGSDGRFSIPGVPTVLGSIFVTATFTPPGQSALTGTSLAVAANRGGVTDVGTVQLIPAVFNTNYGTFITTCDDCNFQRTLPFPFSFYGANQTVAYVGTNGYLTFGSGDSTYTESLPQFNSKPRISAFFDDLIGSGAAGLYINDQIPGQFIVTYLNDRHYSAGGSNTIQMQLFPDGRIIFAYRGITALSTGTIAGLTPGPSLPSQAIDYSHQLNVDVPGGTAIYEYFTAQNLFDLDNGFIVFTPKAGGGYNVRTLPRAPVAATGIVTGAGVNNGAAVPNLYRPPADGTGTRASAQAAIARPLVAASLANGEVTVRSSGNVKYVGMTNTDSQGNFVLSGVPPGGIVVEVRRNGKVIAQGADVFPGGDLTTSQVLAIALAPPVTDTKSGPQQ